MKLAAHAVLLCLCVSGEGLSGGPPASWVPARWTGGRLEVAHRSHDRALADPAVREALSRWYDPSTLDLVSGTPVNCLLVTLTAAADTALEQEQRKLVREYARLARERSLAVLGIVYPGSAIH